MHQTSTGTKKNKKKNKIQQLLRSGPIVPGNFSFFVFLVPGACAGLVHLVVWFFCFFGACAGLVTLTSQNIDRHQKKQKNKPLDAPNIGRHQKNKNKTKIPATTQKWTPSSWKFYFFWFFWCLCRFGASSGLFFGFFGACAGLVILTSQNIDRHQKKQNNQTTRCTKHRQAPKKTKKKQKIQQLLRSGPIVPGNFSFFCFFWCLCRFGASSGFFLFLFFLVPVQVWCTYWFVCFLMPAQVLVILDCVCFGSWPYFKLMFQRSKHTGIFE